MEIPKNLKNYFVSIMIYSFIFTLFVLIIILVNGIIMTTGDEIKNINLVVGLQNHINDNNLSLPFPNITQIKTSQFSPNEEFYLNNFGKPINEYNDLVQQYFIYETKTYDCKYWSYIHILYWEMNYKKYNWKIKLIDTDNHIFVMYYNDSGYIILDQNNINCYGSMNCNLNLN